MTVYLDHVIMCLLMGEGMACGGLPFPGTGCDIYRMLTIFGCYVLTFMFGVLYLF